MRLLTLVFSLIVSAQTMAASIWHVEGDQEFYLFGTIHVLKPDTYPLPTVYDDAFSNCSALWLEIDMDEMKDSEVAHQVRQIMLLPVGDKLKDQLSESAYQVLGELAKKAGLNLAMFQGLKPWAAANLITVTIFQNRGFQIDQGVDLYLQKKAKASNMPIYSFETALWQMNMFDQLASAYSDDFIEFSTNDMENINQLVDDMVRYWKVGDVDALYQQADFGDYRAVEEAILTSRNDAWMKTLLAKKQSGTQCVAVGALHMAAEHGLISQFEKAGYRVTQLK